MATEIKNWLKNVYKHLIEEQKWHRRAIAVLAAICIWLVTNYSITSTKTISNVRVKLINIPSDKTSVNLLSEGYLKQRISLTLTGQNSKLKSLSSRDFEVILDASEHSDKWLANISKKELHFFEDNKGIKKSISNVSHNEYYIELNKLITDNILIKIKRPIGEPPIGYQLLDTWPRELTYSLTGAAEQIRDLKLKGLNLIFNLNSISKGTLDSIPAENSLSGKDEIVFLVPDTWKKLNIPHPESIKNIVEDPDAKKLHITFLRKSLIPIKQKIPVTIFYPVKFLDNINPETYKLSENNILINNNGIYLLDEMLYANNVSQFFLDTVKNNLEIVITASPKAHLKYLDWSVQFIDLQSLEEKYVAHIMNDDNQLQTKSLPTEIREIQLRNRFREYVRNFRLYKEDGSLLAIKSLLNDDGYINIITHSN